MSVNSAEVREILFPIWVTCSLVGGPIHKRLLGRLRRSEGWRLPLASDIADWKDFFGPAMENTFAVIRPLVLSPGLLEHGAKALITHNTQDTYGLDSYSWIR